MDPELPLPEISSQPPEQIPMPESPPMDDRGTPPSSYSRELSPAEKSNALIQFMGAQYGALNQLDSQIEGHGLGKGSSAKVKQQVAQVLESAQAPSAPAQVPPPTTPQQQQVIEPAAVPVNIPVSAPPVEVDSDQLEFDFNVDEKQELLSMVRVLVDNVKAQRKEIDLLTDKIDSLVKISKKKSTRSPRKPAKTKSTGSSRKAVDKASEV